MYFSEQFQVAVGLGAGGQAPPGRLSTEHSVPSLSVLATGRREQPGIQLPVPAASRVAREVLFCPRSANKEQRVEGWAASQV